MNRSIEILYEDDDMLAVNKPAGLVVHGDGRTKEPTLADWLLENYPAIAQVGEPWLNRSFARNGHPTAEGGLGEGPDGNKIPRPGIVHRLDRDTSGVLVVAKTQDAFEFLKKQFQERKVKKTYHTFVYGTPKNDTGVIDKPIGKSKSDFRKRSAEFGARGVLRDAVTAYTVLKRGSDATYLEVKPQTGRTHQIRVHLKSIGHPVVCDSLYAQKRPCLLEFSRLALHAHTLELTTQSEKAVVIEAPLPPDFTRALTLL